MVVDKCGKYLLFLNSTVRKMNRISEKENGEKGWGIDRKRDIISLHCVNEQSISLWKENELDKLLERILCERGLPLSLRAVITQQRGDHRWFAYHWGFFLRAIWRKGEEREWEGVEAWRIMAHTTEMKHALQFPSCDSRRSDPPTHSTHDAQGPCWVTSHHRRWTHTHNLTLQIEFHWKISLF